MPVVVAAKVIRPQYLSARLVLCLRRPRFPKRPVLGLKSGVPPHHRRLRISTEKLNEVPGDLGAVRDDSGIDTSVGELKQDIPMAVMIETAKAVQVLTSQFRLRCIRWVFTAEALEESVMTNLRRFTWFIGKVFRGRRIQMPSTTFLHSFSERSRS